MKEFIFQINNNPAGNDIVVANAPTGLVVKNILAIINKTTGKPVHSPIAEVIDAVTYSGTTMTIALNNGHVSIAGDLLIKAYTDEEGGSDEYSQALAEFFGVTELQGYEFMQDTEVTGEIEDIMANLDSDLSQTVEYPEGSGTYMTKAQAITAEAMDIINSQNS